MKKYFLAIACWGVFSCHTKTNEQIVNETVDKAIAAINKNDYQKINELVSEHSPNADDTELIKYHIQTIYYLTKKYHDGNLKNVRIEITKKHDEFDRLKISIPIFSGFDSTTGITSAILNLYVGPPDIIPLTEFSGFEFDQKVNINYRGDLMSHDKLVPMEQLLKKNNW